MLKKPEQGLGPEGPSANHVEGEREPEGESLQRCRRRVISKVWAKLWGSGDGKEAMIRTLRHQEKDYRNLKGSFPLNPY